MDEALDFSFKKRIVDQEATSPVIKREPVTSNGVESVSPQPSPSASSRSSQSPTSTSTNQPTPFNMYRAAMGGWDPNLMATLASAYGSAPLTPMATTPSAMSSFFPPSFSGPHPDASMFATGSLAMSSLHRRRRSTASAGSQDTDSSSAKKAKCVPTEKKDEAYWERRRKNNEAAKRSRDTRRAKEEEIAIRAAFLEQENLKLRAQVTILKNETAKLHFMLFNHVQPSSAC